MYMFCEIHHCKGEWLLFSEQRGWECCGFQALVPTQADGDPRQQAPDEHATLRRAGE